MTPLRHPHEPTPPGQPIILEMKTYRQRHCWLTWPRPTKNGHHGWEAGSDHCRVLHCRTPWGAVWAAWRQHRATSGPFFFSRRILLGWSLMLTLLASLVLAAITVLDGASLLTVLGAVLILGSAVLQGIAKNGRTGR